MRPRRARAPDDPRAARERALRLLEVRPHAAGELRRKLKERGFAAGAIAGAMAWLAETGLVDDRKFSETFAESRLSTRPQGRRLLVARLMARGVVRETAEEAVEAALDGRDEGTLAAEAARRYLARSGGRIRDERERRRLEGHLLRRGFGYSAVRKAVRAAGGGEAEY